MVYFELQTGLIEQELSLIVKTLPQCNCTLPDHKLRGYQAV